MLKTKTIGRTLIRSLKSLVPEQQKKALGGTTYDQQQRALMPGSAATLAQGAGLGICQTLEAEGVVNSGPLNVRRTPSLEFPPVGSLNTGDSVAIIGRTTIGTADWLCIRWGAGPAFVATRFVDIGTQATEPAQESSPSTNTKAGWSSFHGYAECTPVQRALITAATSAVGGSSGQSIPGGTWLTDIAGGDGERMRQAGRVYAAWKAEPTGSRGMEDAMLADMLDAFAGSAYEPTHRRALVDHIRQRYDATGSVPSDGVATLLWLNIRKQCFEWAVSTAMAAGGRAITYGAPSVAIAAAKPGMGFFWPGGKHSAVILDMERDKDGRPVRVRVGESNWASAWSNPPGGVPWERVVGDRVLDIGDARVVDFES